LLPFEELVSWANDLQARNSWQAGPNQCDLEEKWEVDCDLLRARLRKVIERPEVAQALYIASPSLQPGIVHWRKNPTTKRGLQAQRALVRYFARMSSRATPFGLFSGCSVGRIDLDGRTEITLAARNRYKSCTRLDFDYLFALTDALRNDPNIAVKLRYKPNTSLHRVGNCWQYVECRLTTATRAHVVVKVQADASLDAVLDRSKTGATIQELAGVVLRLMVTDNIQETEAVDYINELIRSQIIVSSLVPLATGSSPLDDLIEQVSHIPSAADVTKTLRATRTSMAELDLAGMGASEDAYVNISNMLSSLAVKNDPGRLFQVDLLKPVESAVLSKDVISELIWGVEALSRVNLTSEVHPLDAFKKQFLERYDRACIPLIDALDGESGIGFGSGAIDCCPLLRDLQFNSRYLSGGQDFTPFHTHLLHKLLECEGGLKTEIELQATDLPEAPGINLFNTSFCVIASLSADSHKAVQEGRFSIFLHGGVTSNGARFFGRFCHADGALERQVRDYLRNEESLDPDAIFAEIVHLPEGRIGNVLCRPALREYEIVYLGRSGLPLDRQLPISDLWLAMENGHLTLYSERLKKRVIPRLSNAHAFRSTDLNPVYRLLCLLQQQQTVEFPTFSWGPLETATFLPRVTLGRMVLTPARWRLTKPEISSLAKLDGARLFAAMQEVRERRKFPRWLVFADGDNALTIDLDNGLLVDAFVHILRRRSEAVVREMYPAGGNSAILGPEGHFSHEIAVPFIRRPTELSKGPDIGPAFFHRTLERGKRSLAPGGEWVYVKLYGTPATLDSLLLSNVAPMIEEAFACGGVSRWFFVRYSDPDFHLRIRLDSECGQNSHSILQFVHDTINSLVSQGKIWRLQFDTYEREIERYGGLDGVVTAEDIFWADSDAVVRILQWLDGDSGLDLRWRLALVSIDAFLRDFGFDLRAKHKILGTLRDSTRNRLSASIEMQRTIAQQFRAQRKRLESLFESGSTEEPELTLARSIITKRSPLIAKAAERLRELGALGKLRAQIPDLVGSYLHMHVNRMVHSHGSAHEVVLYDFLFRLYDSMVSSRR
jgi:thiopeptide-type bacteriocin biosynthesis protein